MTRKELQRKRRRQLRQLAAKNRAACYKVVAK